MSGGVYCLHLPSLVWEEKPLEKEDNEVHSIHDDCHICHPENGHHELVDDNKEFVKSNLAPRSVIPCGGVGMVFCCY